MRLVVAIAFVLIYIVLPDPFIGPVDDIIVTGLGTMAGIYAQVRHNEAN